MDTKKGTIVAVKRAPTMAVKSAKQWVRSRGFRSVVSKDDHLVFAMVAQKVKVRPWGTQTVQMKETKLAAWWTVPKLTVSMKDL